MPSIVSYHPRVFVLDQSTIHVVIGICTDWMSDLDFLLAIAFTAKVHSAGDVVKLVSPKADKSLRTQLAALGIYDVRSEVVDRLPTESVPILWSHVLC